MYSFGINQQGVEKIRKRIILKITVAVSLGVIVSFASVIMNSIKNEEEIPFIPMGLALVGIACFCTFVFGSILKKQREMHGSYRIYLNDERITREMPYFPTVSIPLSDIQSLQTRKKFIVIRGSKRGDVITIPPELEGYDELTELLSRVKLQ